MRAPISGSKLQRWTISNAKKGKGKVAGCQDVTTTMRHEDQDGDVLWLRETGAEIGRKGREEGHCEKDLCRDAIKGQ